MSARTYFGQGQGAPQVNAQGITAALGAGGTLTVACPSIKASSLVFLTARNFGGTAGVLSCSAITANTSFVITSSSNTDTSTVQYLVVTPFAA